MLAVLKNTAAPGITLLEVPNPTPQASEVLVNVRYSSICGTDVGIYDWGSWAKSHVVPPRILGHELVGEVVSIGTDTRESREQGLKVGDLVSSETHIFCGECNQCKVGNKHICERMELFGISRDGGFATQTTIPLRTTWKNNPKVPLKWMSVQEPLGNAVHAVEKAAVDNKSVLIVGLGPVGLCAGQVAKAMGASKVVGIDPSAYRRKLAEQFGFDELFESTAHKNSYEVVLEMSGSQSGIITAGESVAFGGTIIAFGLPKKTVELEWGTFFIDKETTVHGLFGRRIWETWETTTELLTSGKVSLEPLITHEFPLTEFEEAMNVMKSGECGKVIISVAP